MKTVKKVFCIALAALMLGLVACAPAANGGETPAPANTNAPVQHANEGERFKKLSTNIAPAQQSGREPDAAFRKAQADIAVELFKNSLERGENSLVSPLSVMLALAMTANGADANTLAEMERTLGMPIEQLNAYLYSYMKLLAQSSSVKLANSIWFKADEAELDPAADTEPFFTPNQDFLEKNAAIYDADVFAAPFDESTLEALNDWVKKNTDGMIDRMLDEIDPRTVMFLVNTLLFDAEWDDRYAHYQVHDGVFTALSGERQNVEMMHSEEGLWIGDETCSGFLKSYKKSPFAFAALLPEEGTDVNDFIDGLTGERLLSMLENRWEGEVHAAMPKFGFDYSVSLVDALRAMGMTDAFDSTIADFSRLGTVPPGYNLCIGDVKHKTHIDVAENGTRAGAATVVEINAESCMPPSEIREVVLDRPFVFMIMDMETNVPLFIGALTSVE
ncbi:MAG: serpin family protein [Clostridia bacterium]|nr:serpin family protein [Clostridia bacterium]